MKDDKRDFTKEAKLLLNAVMVCYLNLLQLMTLLIFISACHLITVLLDVKTLMLEFLNLYVGAVVVLTVKYSKME